MCQASPVWDLLFAFHEMSIIQCTQMAKNDQKSEKCEHCHFHFIFHWASEHIEIEESESSHFLLKLQNFYSPLRFEVRTFTQCIGWWPNHYWDKVCIKTFNKWKMQYHEELPPANNLMVHLNFAVLVPNSSSNSRNSRFGWRLQSNFQINSQFDLKWLAGVRALVQLLLFLFPTFISRKPS